MSQSLRWSYFSLIAFNISFKVEFMLVRLNKIIPNMANVTISFVKNEITPRAKKYKVYSQFIYETPPNAS
jgi:hypothetical protein